MYARFASLSLKRDAGSLRRCEVDMIDDVVVVEAAAVDDDDGGGCVGSWGCEWSNSDGSPLTPARLASEEEAA